jgi:hypothetical protein
MLSSVEVRDVVTRLVYRPGWDLSVYIDPHEGLHVAIVAEVEDAYPPGQMVFLDIHSALPPFADQEAAKQWMLWRLERVGSHEVREWLRSNGDLVSDPHTSTST